MHAVVTHVTVNDREKALETLRNEVVPRISGAPGFVAAYWTGLELNKGVSMAVFESEEAARAVAGQIQAPPGGEVTMDSIDVGEVVANA